MSRKINFSSKIILITGASGGLGRALCLRFGEAGASILALDIVAKDLAKLNKDLDKKGIPNLCLQADVTDESACQKAIQKGAAHFGRIDLLINNAGITNLELSHKTSTERLHKVLNINFFGSVYCTQAALPFLLKQQGGIVVISSLAGFSPLYGRTAYAASKHALHGYFYSLRCEHQDQLQLLMVCPSFIDTPIRSRSMGQPIEDGNMTQYTTAKSDSPQKIAELIFQAAYRKKRFLITGQTGKMVYFLWKFFPRLYEKIMTKKMKDNF